MKYRMCYSKLRDGLSMLMFWITMLLMGIWGEYLWRTFDASRKRSPYIIEDEFIGWKW